MGMLRGALKTSLAMKAIDILRREASKPQNQAKAKQLLTRASKRRR